MRDEPLPDDPPREDSPPDLLDAGADRSLGWADAVNAGNDATANQRAAPPSSEDNGFERIRGA